MTGVNPANGSTGVARDVTVAVDFSERVNPLTVDAASLRLLNGVTGQVVEASVSVSADRRGALLVPAVQLSANTLYYPQALGSILDQAGNPLAFFQTSFTTGP